MNLTGIYTDDIEKNSQLIIFNVNDGIYDMIYLYDKKFIKSYKEDYIERYINLPGNGYNYEKGFEEKEIKYDLDNDMLWELNRPPELFNSISDKAKKDLIELLLK